MSGSGFTLPRATDLAHALVGKCLQEGELAVDATVGNGHDAVFLARCVGERGRVIGCDLQEAALVEARRELEMQGVSGRVVLHRADHERLTELVPEGHGVVGAVMFNLGYLPGGDHGVVTQVGSTLAGLGGALELLRPGGILSVVCYPGHEGGGDESDAVRSWAEGLEAARFRSVVYSVLNAAKAAPFLVAIERRGT